MAQALFVVGTLDADRKAYCPDLLKEVDAARDAGLPVVERIAALLKEVSHGQQG